MQALLKLSRLSKTAPRNAGILLVVVLIIAAILAGASVVPPIGRGTVGVIELYSPILGAGTRDSLTEMINYAMRNSTIQAVVLKIDSPGGSVDAVQEVYLSLQRLKAQKPVVSIILGFGTSGAYYIAVGSNYIYSTRASLVGNVGVIGFKPPKVGPFEDIVETGPQKLTGFSEKDFRFKIQSLQQDFLNTVFTNRGDKIKVSREEVAKAGIFLGYEAVEDGLVDSVGSSIDAAEKAARLAGLSEYRTVVLNDLVKRSTSFYYSFSSNATLNLKLLSRLRNPPAFYYIYVPNTSPALAQAQPQNQTVPANATKPAGVEERAVYIDYAHKNAFEKEELSILVFELATRGQKVRYVEPADSVEGKYSEASTLIIVNPTRPFNDSELSAIHSMLDRGGTLILISEPTRVRMNPINSVASDFGLMFGNGYLYDMNQSDGNYRDIVVTRFSESPVTKGIGRMVLFTAAPIYSNGHELAITANTTSSSESEIKTNYSPMIFIKDKRVLALGDFTFLKEPFCYSEDNYHFITNLADYVAAR